MTTAEAREGVGAARLAIVSARHHQRNLDKAMDAIIAAVRAEERLAERARVVKALLASAEQCCGCVEGCDWKDAAAFVESLDRGEG